MGIPHPSREIGGSHWTLIYIVLTTVYASLIVLGALHSTSLDEGAQNAYETIKKFKYQNGITYKKIDPVSDNLIVFGLYKSLAAFFCFLETLKKGENEGVLANILSFDDHRTFCILFLKFFSLFLQSILVHFPIMMIVETVYKKNSDMFKCLIISICLTSCMLVGFVTVDIDY